MDYRKLLKKSGALLDGHFLLTSGLHSNRYIEKMRILENPEFLDPFIEKMKEISPDADWIIGPTLGGVILAYELARITGSRSGYAEREGNGRILKRDYGIKENDRILLVDDVLTTGSSLLDTKKAINRGNIIGATVLIDRSIEELLIDIPLYSVLSFPIENFEPENCPLCKKNIPLTKRGGS